MRRSSSGYIIPFGRHRKFVIYSAIDDCTRIVYSKVYNAHNIENTKDFLNELTKRFKFSIKTVRTDQGIEFSKTITRYLEGLGIEHVKNEPYHPEHNGKIERYHKTQNIEIDKRYYLIGLEEANYNLWQRDTHYNYKRKHLGLGMNGLTPMQKLDKTYLNLFL